MALGLFSEIVGTGSYLPTQKVTNSDFLSRHFLDDDGNELSKSNQETINTLEAITSIEERRFVTDDLVASDIAFFAAKDALDASGIDPESLDYIIVAHNFGDVHSDNRRSDLVPSLASRVKHSLKIRNPYAVAYDIAFGCPGWIQGVIQANYYLKSGEAKRALVIGVETLSRVADPHDRNSLLYSDGAGAVILEAKESETPTGILSHLSRTDTIDETYFLWMGESFNKEKKGEQIYLKMDGRKLYKYALKQVPQLVKACLEKANLDLDDIKKVLIHQANGKMDEAILDRLFSLYGKDSYPDEVLPMTISYLGNSSVATVPTLLDMIVKHKLEGHELVPGDKIVLSSVGAGMNINCIVYQMPEKPL